MRYCMDKINVLIIGTDINAYYMSRCYHELTGKKVNLIGKAPMAFTSTSNITNIKIEEDLWNSKTFVETLINYAKEQNLKEKILLIGTNDHYVRLIIENRKLLENYYVFNYPDINIVNNLLIKENFYENYKNMGLDMPKTYIYKCNQNDDIIKIKEFFKEYPLIIKPSDGVEYHYLEETLDKVYKAKTENELEQIILKIEKAGYKNNLIIQEFIPGDDSALFDSIFYVGKNKKAQIATFAQIGLQEHTPTGIGNCTVLVNGFDEHGYKEELIYKLKDFLEKIGYQGFCEFDIKYDSRDEKYKVLEINPRQSRSGYYVAACGHNLVEYLIDDLIFNKEKNFKIIKEKLVLSFVPKKIINKYIENKKLKEEIFKLIKNKKIVNPLKYSKDNGFKRKKYLFLRDRNYIQKYKKYTF